MPLILSTTLADTAGAADSLNRTSASPRALADAAAAADVLLQHTRLLYDGAAAADSLARTLLVGITATASRVRTGTAAPATRVTYPTLTAQRTRGGYSVPQTVTAGGTVRVSWRFDDPVTGVTYLFDINPNAGGSAHAKRTLTTVPTTAGDGQPLIFEGEDDLEIGQFDGRFHQKSQYDAFKVWFAKKRPVLLTDDLGRQSVVVIESFKPKRKGSVQHAYRHDYSVGYRILQRYAA